MAYFNKRPSNGSIITRTILGLLIIVASVLGGLYVGGWIFFVGGIVEVIEAIKATPVEAIGVAVGILKVVLASTVGVLVAVLGAMFGASLLP